MRRIDPSIIVHEIKTYLTIRTIRKKILQVHPRKATAIKAKVEKLLKDGFIYPMPLTEWVFNIAHVSKKHGTIRFCIDFRDLNKACPKENFPTPHIDQIIDNCVESVMFSFMDGFFSYNHIEILPYDQQKWNLFSHTESLLIEIFLSV